MSVSNLLGYIRCRVVSGVECVPKRETQILPWQILQGGLLQRCRATNERRSSHTLRLCDRQGIRKWKGGVRGSRRASLGLRNARDLGLHRRRSYMPSVLTRMPGVALRLFVPV